MLLFRALIGGAGPLLAVAALLGGCTSDSTPMSGSAPTVIPRATAAPLATGDAMLTSPTPTAAPVALSPSAPSPGPVETDAPTMGRTPFPRTTQPTPIPVEEELFPVPPERDLYQLVGSLVLKSDEPISRVVNPDPVSYIKGREDTFSVTDIQDARTYTSRATLALVSPHAYWYVEEGLKVSRGDLEKAAEAFESQIYPRVTAVFGTEWVPGVDNDAHLTILHARLRGVAGYFSSVDEYPIAIHEHSNQREMLYMSSSLRVGSRQYLAVLAHELQHAIHWNADPSEETWVNEGLSEVATGVAGYTTRSPGVFLGSPTVSLVNWPVDNAGSLYYGASNLFFDYLAGHYGSIDDLARLLNDPADGIRGVDSYLRGLGYEVDFTDVFRDWAVANYLDEPDGPYSYAGRDVQVRGVGRIGKPGERTSSIPQYSAEYTSIDITKGDVVVGFRGERGVPLLESPPKEGGCWWSNQGDSISSTLTLPVHLPSVDGATLRYSVWFDVEEDWDYGYLQVSVDGGETWDIIATPSSSPKNPVGNSFGPGYTGRSEGWLEEVVDLGAYADQRVLLRFHYVTDDAINGAGFCVAEISLRNGHPLDEDDGWEADGFAWVDGPVPQEYIVQVIEVGDETTVTRVELDHDNRGEILVTGLEELDDLVVVVVALAPKTRTPAGYTLTVERRS